MRCHVLRGWFPIVGKVDKVLHFYEMMDPDIRFIPEQQLMFESNESELVLIASTVKELMLRKSSR